MSDEVRSRGLKRERSGRGLGVHAGIMLLSFKFSIWP